MLVIGTHHASKNPVEQACTISHTTYARSDSTVVEKLRFLTYIRGLG